LYRKPRRPEQSAEELRYIEDAIASIKLRITHHDPYEEWEKETKKEAFVRHPNAFSAQLRPHVFIADCPESTIEHHTGEAR
jgi:hypothetical protein